MNRLRTALLCLAVAGAAAAATGTDTVPARGGWLGVYSEDLSQPMLTALDIDHGVLVTDVAEGSPAARAGVESGDVIVGLDGEDVHDAADLRFLVRARPGRAVDLVIRHRGREKQLSATLESRRTATDLFDLDWTGMTSGALRQAGKALRDLGPQAESAVGQARVPALDSLRRQLDDLRQQIDELRSELRRKGKGN